MLTRYAEAVASIGQVIAEAGMSRVFDQMADGPFAMICAYRPHRSLQENESKMRDLKIRAAELGYGFVEGPGIWGGNPGEPTLFIAGISQEDAVAMGKDYLQAAVIWGDQGRYSEVSCITGEVIPKGLVSDHFKFLGKIPNAEPWGGPNQGLTELNKNQFTLVPPRERPIGEAHDTAKNEEMRRELGKLGLAKAAFFFHRARPVGVCMGTFTGYELADSKVPPGVGDFLVYLPVEYPTHMLAQALHEEISRVKPEDKKTLYDRWEDRKLP